MLNPLQGLGSSPEDAQPAQAAINKARKWARRPSASATTFEGGGRLLRGFHTTVPERARQLRARKAYESLAAKYPNDDRAQIFYALYLAGTADGIRPDVFRVTSRRPAILEKQFAKHPDHSGGRALPDP